jgi:putative DNA primase/helicase
MSNDQPFDTGCGYSTIRDEPKANGANGAIHSQTTSIGAASKPRKQGGTDKGGAPAGLVTICAADVTPKRVRAIWEDREGGIRLAQGEHTLIAGIPGLGKSQTSIAMAAAVSTGSDWPCGQGRAPLGSVIILAAEDSIEHTIVPRLIAAGADLNRVHFVQAVKERERQRTFSFQADFEKLAALVKEIGDVVLIIIDPVTAYMGKIDSHKNAEVRAVLAPLGQLAQECNVAIASITHLSKANTNSTKAIDRIIGSVAFIAAPRIGLIVIADPKDSDRRLLLHVKNNLSRPPVGLAFRIGGRVVSTDDKGDFSGSCILWETEPVAASADDALQSDGNSERTAKDDAVAFLQSVLADGPVMVEAIEMAARSAGLLGEDKRIGQNKPFRSARDHLGIESFQPKGLKAAGWCWALPGRQMPSERSDALRDLRASEGGEL